MLNKSIVIITASIIIFTGFIFYRYSQRSVQNKPISSQELIEGPHIKVEPEIYDLGTVVYGEVASHTFKVSNLGNQPLEILRLSTSCGCTKANIEESDRIIAPGQSIDMLVTFDPAVHKDNSDLGEVVRIVYIKTNDPDSPETEVEIRADVVKSK